MASATLLRIDDLSLRFGGLTVLDRITLDVYPGKLTSIIGPNGAGKTSVLNCISGLYHATSGDILFEGNPITGLKPDEIARLGLARTFQHGELFPQMTVLENLLVARHSRFRTGLLSEGVFVGRVRRQEIAHRAAVEEIIDLVELSRYRKQRVSNLAFGLQKVVGFARALAMEPKILLLDEPSSGLNREEKEDLARFILRIKREIGMSMIWVEHDMQMVADLADVIHVLDHGKYLTHGAPEEVLVDPRVVEAYLGSTRS